MDCARVAGVLLAAGRGTRFGGNKLETTLGDAMLGLHAARTLASAGCGYLFAVHDPANGKLAVALCNEGFSLVPNNDPAAGMAQSIALAVGAAMQTDADAILICLGDMPFVTVDHLRAVVSNDDAQAVASAIDDVRMPPAMFNRLCWPKLTALSGDSGARRLLYDGVGIQGDRDMLADIDTIADLNRWS